MYDRRWSQPGLCHETTNYISCLLQSVPCCHPPPILPPRCNSVLCSHAAAKIVELQDPTDSAGGCRWWSTVSHTLQGLQSKRSLAMMSFFSPQFGYPVSSHDLKSLKRSTASAHVDRFHNHSYYLISVQTSVSNYIKNPHSTGLGCRQWLLSGAVNWFE